MRRFAIAPVLGLFICLLGRPALAEPLQAPAGGKPIALPAGQVACGPAGGWTVEADARAVRPPVKSDPGVSAELKVAPNPKACAASTAALTLIATGPMPAFDATATALWLDDGRLEVRGHRLRGVRLSWTLRGKSGDDVCTDPAADGAMEKCALAVPKDGPADPKALAIHWSPAGARSGAATFDAEGKPLSAAATALSIARVVVARLLPADAVADVTAGTARILVAHAEAVTSAECTGGSCEMAGGALMVREVTALSDKLAVQLQLAPHVFYRRGAALEAAPTLMVDVLHCPLAVASGPPLEDVDDAKAIVRAGGSCAGAADSYRWTVDGKPVTVVGAVKQADGAYLALAIGRVEGELTIQAHSADGSVVASTRVRAAIAPHPHAALVLDGVGTIDIIPTNRAARVEVPAIASGRLVVLPVAGAYTVEPRPGAAPAIRGVSKAVGFVSLRYAVRAEGVPASLRGVDLGTLNDALAMPLREANVPTSLGARSQGKSPIVELVCADKDKRPLVVPPGVTTHVPYSQRDSCRFVFHKERLPPEDGAQKLNLELDVTRVDGTPRLQAHVRDQFVLRPGAGQRLAWIKGVQGEFDRVTARLSHSADESHYTGPDPDGGLPSAQWSAVMGTSKARIYATTAIPTGLYRLSDKDHSGILTLNFGVLARLTWLSDEGHEGFLGFELGAMGIGLAHDTSATGESLTQFATVTGVGLSVPIANRSLATETSVNLHAWYEFELSRVWGGYPGNANGFVFGPSISIGNIGANL